MRRPRTIRCEQLESRKLFAANIFQQTETLPMLQEAALAGDWASQSDVLTLELHTNLIQSAGDLDAQKAGTQSIIAILVSFQSSNEVESGFFDTVVTQVTDKEIIDALNNGTQVVTGDQDSPMITGRLASDTTILGTLQALDEENDPTVFVSGLQMIPNVGTGRYDVVSAEDFAVWFNEHAPLNGNTGALVFAPGHVDAALVDFEV
ncbi:MAG: hypothetical protein AAF802_11470 [Planctomycetota bacterium]